MTHNSKETSPSPSPSPPPYTESTNHIPSPPHPFPPGQSLIDTLTRTRSTHIHSVIETHLVPLIQKQASVGISCTTIAMFPSDVSLSRAQHQKSDFDFDFDFATEHSATSPVEVVGFLDEGLKVIRLEGEIDSVEFWRVEAVMGELERVLSARLNEGAALGREGTHDLGLGQERLKRRGLGWNRVVASLGTERKTADASLGVRTREVGSAGQVLVTAGLEEVCLRTVSEFGLYGTVSKQCVVVRVDAKC